MDTILIAVTALSLAMAAGMGAMLMRTLRVERRRSAARVELLEQLAGNRPAAVVDDFELRPGAARAEAGPAIFSETFEDHGGTSAWPRRFAAIGAMIALVGVVFLGWRALDSAGSSDLPVARESAAARTALPLELLSLQHAQQDGALVISGVVQNPRGSAPLANVQATAALFAADGLPLITTRAPIDFTTLAPGDESSFVIRIPSAAAVARYRVGFRAGDDAVLNHVDRRNAEGVARKEVP